MTADESTASRASPFLVLGLKEPVDPVFLDSLEVFNETHFIEFLVPMVYLF